MCELTSPKLDCQLRGCAWHGKWFFDRWWHGKWFFKRWWHGKWFLKRWWNGKRCNRSLRGGGSVSGSLIDVMLLCCTGGRQGGAQAATVTFCTALQVTVLHCLALHRTAFLCPALHKTVLAGYGESRSLGGFSSIYIRTDKCHSRTALRTASLLIHTYSPTSLPIFSQAFYIRFF